MMKKQTEYCMTSGEFARICRTTRETLRYYHRQAILVPKKNKENGYYYYSYAQISSYYFIKTFRDLGCSVADIKTYLLGGEQVRFDDFVDRQYQLLEEQRRELDHRMAVVSHTRKLLKQIREADTGKPVLMEFAEKLYMFLTPVQSSPATSSEEISKDIRKHQSRCKRPGVQTFPMGASIDQTQFLSGDYSYKCVFSFAGEEATGEDLVELPSQKVVASVVRDSDGDIRIHYQAITEYLKEHNLIPCSDIYSLSIVNVIDPQEERKYLKYLFVAVQS